MQKYLLTILMSIFIGCSPRGQSSTVIGSEFNVELNQTSHLIVPGREILIPGKWDRSGYKADARQQFYKNKNGRTLSVGVTNPLKYPFNKDKNLKGMDFVLGFYNWEVGYFKKHGYVSEMLQKTEKFIIWKLIVNGTNNVYLQSQTGPWFLNFMIVSTENDNLEDDIVFLKKWFDLNIQP